VTDESWGFTYWKPGSPDNADKRGAKVEPPFVVCYFNHKGSKGVQWNDLSASDRRWQGGFLVEWDEGGIPTQPENSRVLFDGESLDGWRVVGDSRAFTVEDGILKTTARFTGSLFYVGDGSDEAQFSDFDLRMQVQTQTRGNSGVWVHAAENRRGGLPGLEVQIYNGGNDDRLTGSLYGINSAESTGIRDGDWFSLRILVEGETITTFINDVEVIQWKQPADWNQPARSLDRGLIGLQGHKKGPVWFKDIVLTVPD